MGTDPTPGVPPRPAYAPTVPAEPPRSGPPRWAWWVAGIVVPLAGIAASIFVATTNNSAPAAKAPPAPAPTTGNSSPGSQANGPALSTSPPASGIAPPPSLSPLPSKTPPPAADLASPAGYTLNQTMFGITPGQCTNFEEQLTDLDTGQSRIVVPQNVTRPTEVEAGGAELLYWNESCDYRLRAMPQATVGILRKGTPGLSPRARPRPTPAWAP